MEENHRAGIETSGNELTIHGSRQHSGAPRVLETKAGEGPEGPIGYTGRGPQENQVGGRA